MNGAIVDPVATSAEALVVLGRSARVPLISQLAIPSGTILVTGGLGSIGVAVADALTQSGREVVALDVDQLDVTNAAMVRSIVQDIAPSTILHLAGAKHAPAGERDPLECVRVNTLGTQHVIDAAAEIRARVVTASTCKACDPETAYGASKLIAERVTLNAGGRVARFHNVIESSGNVFELWRGTPGDEPISVDPTASRLFIARAEAVALLVFAASDLAEDGARYSISEPVRRTARWLASTLHPDRATRPELRRGDRRDEPYMAACEQWRPTCVDAIWRIVGDHDAARSGDS